MMRKYAVFIFIPMLSSCSLVNIYETKTTEFIKWETIPVFKDFVSPWNGKAFGETTFQYYNDTTWFYFLFKVVDEDIQICDTSLNDALNTLQSDRVELFFTKDSLMQPYYTFEMDAVGRLFDARCFILPQHKTNPKQINANWHIDENDFRFTSNKTKRGYIVEGKVRMSFLQSEQLILNNKLWCGIQRADFSATSPAQWICAKDPQTNHPEFHCWGVFKELSVNR